MCHISICLHGFVTIETAITNIRDRDPMASLFPLEVLKRKLRISVQFGLNLQTLIHTFKSKVFRCTPMGLWGFASNQTNNAEIYTIQCASSHEGDQIHVQCWSRPSVSRGSDRYESRAKI